MVSYEMVACPWCVFTINSKVSQFCAVFQRQFLGQGGVVVDRFRTVATTRSRQSAWSWWYKCTGGVHRMLHVVRYAAWFERYMQKYHRSTRTQKHILGKSVRDLTTIDPGSRHNSYVHLDGLRVKGSAPGTPSASAEPMPSVAERAASIVLTVSIFASSPTWSFPQGFQFPEPHFHGFTRNYEALSWDVRKL